MWEFITAEWWVPRSQCGYFPQWLIWTYGAANVFIWLSYESIPWTIRHLSSRGVHVVEDRSARRFRTFIQFCGRGHLLDGVFVFFWPHYVVFTVWHVATAVVSVYTAVTLRSMFRPTISPKESTAIASIVEKHGVDIEEELAILRESSALISKGRRAW